MNPMDGAKGVDPGQPIAIKFNKSLDFNWLCSHPSEVSISPSESLALDYDDASKTLTVNVHPYLDSGTTYVVSVAPAVKSLSGDTLSQPVSCQFTTGDEPAGDVQINGGSPYVNDNLSVTLNLWYNDPHLKVRIANNQADVAQAPKHDVRTTLPWTLDSGDGPHAVYVQFVNATSSSTVRSATIVRDTVAPAAQFSLPQYYNASNTSVTLNAAASSDLNGIAEYIWSASPSTGVTFNSSGASAEMTMTAAAVEGEHDITLTVRDQAGNLSAPLTLPILKDTVAPGTPDPDAHGLRRTPSPQVSLTPTWYYPGPGNPQDPTDLFVVQLDGQQSFSVGPLSLIPDSYTPVVPLEEDISPHTLSVAERDLAGNLSPALQIVVFVTPVIPLDDGAAVLNSTLSWRAFSGTPGATYTVHLGSISGNVFTEESAAGSPWNTTSTAVAPVFSRFGDYYWYIEWPGGRSPSGSDMYHHFSITK